MEPVGILAVSTALGVLIVMAIVMVVGSPCCHANTSPRFFHGVRKQWTSTPITDRAGILAPRQDSPMYNSNPFLKFHERPTLHGANLDAKHATDQQLEALAQVHRMKRMISTRDNIVRTIRQAQTDSQTTQTTGVSNDDFSTEEVITTTSTDRIQTTQTTPPPPTTASDSRDSTETNDGTTAPQPTLEITASTLTKNTVDITMTITTDVTGSLDVNTTRCPQQDEQASLTDFGKFGIVALGVAIGLAILLCCVLFKLLCSSCCKRRKRKMPIAETASDLHTPGVIYRPRPSLSRSTACVPTPLAMIMNEYPSTVIASSSSSSSNNNSCSGHHTHREPPEKKVVLVTDLDDTLDPMLPEVIAQETLMDRKGSYIDPSKVSTFLLRQNSLRQDVEV